MTIKKIITEISDKVKAIPGVVGVVLGGSRARGTHNAKSDIDIGIYYDEEEGFNTRNLNRLATEIDDENRENLITTLGEWGPWVNGGGWLMVNNYHVDFLFRDINRVSQVIDDCVSGIVTPHYQTGHPHAYLNVMYMGEVSICKILSDTNNRVENLKSKTRPYSEVLKSAIINHFLFEASFSLMLAEKSIKNDDIYYVAGHSFRAVSCLNQVLFAANEEYCINEKRAVTMIDSFKIKPTNYKNRIDKLFHLLSDDQRYTKYGITVLERLITETKSLLDN